MNAALDPQEPPCLLDPSQKPPDMPASAAMMMFPTEWSRSSTPLSNR